jgi:hypothetical protein
MFTVGSIAALKKNASAIDCFTHLSEMLPSSLRPISRPRRAQIDFPSLREPTYARRHGINLPHYVLRPGQFQ